MAKVLAVIGLALTLAGAAFGFFGVWVSKKQAVDIGVTRFASENDDENLQLPAVRNLVRQSRFAMAGFVLIGLGTIIQIGSVFVD